MYLIVTYLVLYACECIPILVAPRKLDKSSTVPNFGGVTSDEM